MIRYEYKLVDHRDVDTQLKLGWEPVPHVDHIYLQPFNRPEPKVFLRKAVGGSE